MNDECPVCGEIVPFPADVIIGELTDCPSCGQELEAGQFMVMEVGWVVADVPQEDWGE